MTQPLYQPRVYAGVDERSVRAELVREGWDPLVFADPPGTVYPPHRHPETKLRSSGHNNVLVNVLVLRWSDRDVAAAEPMVAD
jgi:hypothetical protein